jgi:uncharacterized protein DUF1569
MSTLFDDAERARILARLHSLRADSPRGWGKMTLAQALCHCAIALEVVTGERPMRQKFIGKVLGPFFRGRMLGPEPFSRNSPTGPELIVSGPRDFARERERVVALIGRFAAAGPESASQYVHGFIGRLTGDEWGRLMRKHLDHHLRQFGA